MIAEFLHRRKLKKRQKAVMSFAAFTIGAPQADSPYIEDHFNLALAIMSENKTCYICENKYPCEACKLKKRD